MSLPAQSERTLRMKRSFMQLHNCGYSIKEIARLFDLDGSSVYRLLDEIVTSYNAEHPDAPITREQLLERPHSPHISYERAYAPVIPIDLSFFRSELQDALTSVNSLLSTIWANLTVQESFRL